MRMRISLIIFLNVLDFMLVPLHFISKLYIEETLICFAAYVTLVSLIDYLFVNKRIGIVLASGIIFMIHSIFQSC